MAFSFQDSPSVGEIIQNVEAPKEVLADAEPEVEEPGPSQRRAPSMERPMSPNEEIGNSRDRRAREGRLRKRKSPSCANSTHGYNNIQRRRAISSSPSNSENSSRDSSAEKHCRHRRNNRTPPMPYSAQAGRERSRLRQIRQATDSPARRFSRERRSNSTDIIENRVRRRPRTPPVSPGGKIPYFNDAVRERDRLRQRYRSPSPIVTSSRHRASRSRTSRRCRSRSTSHSHSRSRSKSSHRKSTSERHRHKRDRNSHKSCSAAPQIITIPVPVPDYSFAFSPFCPQRGWPPMPMRSTRFPYHRQRNHRPGPFNTSPSTAPPPFSAMPSMRFMPPFGIPLHNSVPLNRPPVQGYYRYPYT